jgi:hypothetical protein
MALSLSPHVHSCCDNGVVVLLDLRANRYFALPPAAISATGAAIGGLPPGKSNLTDAGVALLRRQSALLETDAPRAQPDELARVRTGAALMDRPDVSRTDALLFAAACTLADIEVRRGALEGSVAAIQRAKANSTSHRAVERAGVFSRLRIWYPHARVCLFDSLALARFLAWRGCAFDLVFAVRSRPFAAHCWIESEGAALNDFYDTHAAFTPILRV